MSTRIRSFVAVVTVLLLASPLAFADEDDQAQGPQDLEVLEAETAPDIDDREPVDATDTFGQGDAVNTWLAVQAPDETTLEVSWQVDGEQIHTFDLDVGPSPRWRTWAQMTVNQTGDWDVEIRDENGDALETVSFSVEE